MLDGTLELVIPWIGRLRKRSSLRRPGKKRDTEFFVVRHLNATWGCQKKTRSSSPTKGSLFQVGWLLNLLENFVNDLWGRSKFRVSKHTSLHLGARGNLDVHAISKHVLQTIGESWDGWNSSRGCKEACQCQFRQMNWLLRTDRSSVLLATGLAAVVQAARRRCTSHATCGACDVPGSVHIERLVVLSCGFQTEGGRREHRKRIGVLVCSWRYRWKIALEGGRRLVASHQYIPSKLLSVVDHL